MQAIILVHGIMGSKLKLGTEEIWPPSLGEMIQDHYTRIGKLRDPRAVPTDILYQYTSFYQIYGPSRGSSMRYWPSKVDGGRTSGSIGALIC